MSDGCYQRDPITVNELFFYRRARRFQRLDYAGKMLFDDAGCDDPAAGAAQPVICAAISVMTFAEMLATTRSKD